MKEIKEKESKPEVLSAIVDTSDIELFYAFHKSWGYWQPVYVTKFTSHSITFSEFKEDVRKTVLQFNAQGSEVPIEIRFARIKP